jgi:hypothetical protein
VNLKACMDYRYKRGGQLQIETQWSDRVRYSSYAYH